MRFSELVHSEYWDNRLSLGFSAPKYGTDRLFRNVGKKLPLLAA